jgi:MFS family permease
MTSLQAFMVVTLPVTGMAYAVLGALKVPLCERLKLDEAKAGGLVSSFGLMVGPIILLSGFFADALGRKGVWVAGSAMVAASLFVMSRARTYLVAVVAVLLLSGGWAAMVNVANALTYQAYANVFMATNLLNFLFGLGAFVTPPVLAWLIVRITFPKALTAFGLTAAMTAVSALGVNMQAAPVAAPAAFGALLADPVMWLCAITMIFWVPVESATAVWTTSLVASQSPRGEPQETSQRLADWTLSGFWLCFMGSRLAAAVLAGSAEVSVNRAVQTARLSHIVLAALCLAIVLGLAFSRKRALTILLLLFAGVIYGPFFPNLLAVLLNHFPAELHGRAVGVLFGCASIGWTVVPALIGKVAARTTLQRGFLVAAADALLLLAMVVAHFIYSAN